MLRHFFFESPAYIIAFRLYVRQRGEAGDFLPTADRWKVIVAAVAGDQLFKLFSTNHSPHSSAGTLHDLLCGLPRIQAPAAIDYRNVFRVIIMQFMDAWGFDVRSVKKTCMHIAHPDGRRIVPFGKHGSPSFAAEPWIRRDSVGRGCLFGCLWQVVFIAVSPVAIVNWPARANMRPNFLMVSWGVTQWIALVPLILQQREKHPATVQGLIVSGCIGLLLSSACAAIPFR